MRSTDERAPVGLGKSLTDIERYDRAVATYLVGITDKLVFAPTSKARLQVTKMYSEDTRKDQDHIPWAFISYYRHPQFVLDNQRDGFPNRMVGENVSNVMLDKLNIRKSTYVKALPINLTYSVDVWSGTHRHLLELSELVATRLYFNQRVLTAPVDISEDETARFAVQDIDWTDNSDIESEEEYGRIYRHTFTFTIDAVLKVVKEYRTYPLDMSKILIDIYEGDDINAEVCEKCDFERLRPEG